MSEYHGTGRRRLVDWGEVEDGNDSVLDEREEECGLGIILCSGQSTVRR